MEDQSLCTQLGNWLSATSWQEPAGVAAIAAHIRACPHCCKGLVRLPEHFRFDNDLTHDQCLASLPTYYEATRPEYPLVSMPDADLVAVTLHLATCAQCREIYDSLCVISELEEQGEE
jgi:hypothetical protein